MIIILILLGIVYDFGGGVSRISKVIWSKIPLLNESRFRGSFCLYTGKDMREAHKDLHITTEEFDEVGVEIAKALDHFNVPEREKQEVLAAIVAKKTEVVNG
jgi:hypothetical protein